MATTRERLQAAGFAPCTEHPKVPGERLTKVAGVWQWWKHADGRIARVNYTILSRVGQSSMGAGARWGYTVRVEAA